MKNKLKKTLIVVLSLTIVALSYSSNNEEGGHEGKLNREEQKLLELGKKDTKKIEKNYEKDSAEKEQSKEKLIKQMQREVEGGPHNNN